MKPELKRIEAALQQLANQPPNSKAVSEPWLDPAVYPTPPISSDYVSSLAEAMLQREISEESVSSLSSVSSTERSPNLPKFAIASNDHQESARYLAANPTLAINLLKEMQTTLGNWLNSLQEVTKQIQALYDEGPIVDGWLESYNSDGQPSDPQHSIVEQALKYLNETHRLPEQPTNVSPDNLHAAFNPDATKAEYRLCGLDEDGQLWYRHCPANQVPDVSLAIVRYQRLQNLLLRKQSLETRLHHFAEGLVALRGQIAE